MSITDNLNNIKNTLPNSVTLVAVSKYKPNESILEAYTSGHRVFGENRVQELVGKYETLPKDIEWHMIGHLQTNKVKYIAPFVSLIHAVDSLKLLSEINKQAKKHNRIINCLLQFHIAQEESKHGFKSFQDAVEVLTSETFKGLKNLKIIGVMGMATNTSNANQVRKEFKQLKSIFDSLKCEHFENDQLFKEISMGMSNDYPIAIQELSTIIRVGSKIFKHN